MKSFSTKKIALSLAMVASFAFALSSSASAPITLEEAVNYCEANHSTNLGVQFCVNRLCRNGNCTWD